MLDKALEVLKILNDNDYEAYVVGGYVRDHHLKRKTNDIDICTSATPKEILEIFDNVTISDMQYGSVVISYKGYNFDVTTFRKEIKYESNRKPVKIKYIKDLKKDLLRRDFTINTLCMNSKGEIIDVLNVVDDLNKKILRTVGNPRYRIKEDSLRILRCIRFATILDFNIDDKTKYYLSKYGYLLKCLSMNRKKEELDKIFLSKNKEKGRSLLIELNLVNSLDINKLNSIILCTDLLGIWCQLEVDDIYPFTKYEKQQMKQLRELLNYDEIDNYLLYKYGLYVNTIAGINKGLSKQEINKAYQELPIKVRSDINITAKEICEILNKEPSSFLNDIFKQLEIEILTGNLQNINSILKEYILNHFPNL